MSRTIRKQLFSTVDLLRKTHKVLEGSLLKKQVNEQEVMGLLADMQEVAISMGTMIEQIYGEGEKTVKELEQYCETLYRLTLALQNLPECRNLLKQLKQQAGRIRVQVGKDIPDRLEAVFLPYKASMWDSLESIWKAAKEDEEAEVYVIPIPYFDRNPDTSFGKMHYEGDLFPDEVKVTDYQNYDFELRRPDIIFIHNPYDDGNYVTSVHPFFYSQNLKKFTEKLVYVPYFVGAGDGVAEGMALAKGVWNADYVIVQSEDEKQSYIRHFQKYDPRIDPADKLLPLGSPKFDKARAVRRGEVEIPEDWKKKAGGRKVLLYNTSLSCMLNGNEAYMEKLERVFDFFAGREDAVLLWRPHPLMETTFASMRPELYGRYQKLRERFIEEEIGIYDDSSDMYPAIGFSDAYYGDWSSLVWLYRETGKPVMIQDVNVQ